MAFADHDIFQVLADSSHGLAILILLFAFYRNKSSEGVSLLTQVLYLIVFVTRYLDLFAAGGWSDLWTFCFKIFFIATSALTVFLMLRVFVRTREKEAAWKLVAWSTAACLVTAPFVMMIFEVKYQWSFAEFLWNFSLSLESVCILPQLLLLRQTSVPTVLDSYYLVALGSYRFLYIPHWIMRGVYGEYLYPQSIIFGVLQTLLYFDFAWVYYTRQRVKLRGGGIVDADDLSKSFLVRRFIGTRSKNPADDEVDEDAPLAGQENGTIDPSGGRAGTHWGARGISVSADEDLPEHEARGATEISDPSHFEDDEDDDAPQPPAKDSQFKDAHQGSELEGSASHWSRE